MPKPPGFAQGGDLEFRVLSTTELAVVQFNLHGFERLFAACRKQCGNPECRYPLSALEANHELPFMGDVCDLCYTMFHVVNRRPGLVAAHNEWFDENKRRAKNKSRLTGDDYFAK